MKLLQNFLSLAVAEMLSKLATFAAFAYLARILGPATFGYVEFAGAVLMCASLIVDQGFSAFGAREIAKAPEQTKHLAAEVVTARVILAFAGYLSIVVFAILIDRGPLMTRLLLVYGLSLWALPLLLQWVFQGHDRMGLVAIAQVVRQFVFAATIFAFVRGPEQVVMVAWAEVAAVSVAASFCLLMYLRDFGRSAFAGPTISSRLFREGVPIGLSQMFWVVKMFGGTLILGLLASAQDVAFYAGAQRVLVALHAFVWLYYFNLLPSMTRAWQKGNAEFTRLMHDSMRWMVWVASVVTIVWAMFSHDAMRIIYGRDFTAAGTVLGLFAIVWALTLIDGHYRYGLIAAGHQNAEMMTAALGAVVALVLMPIGYHKAGLNGAAAGLIVAETAIWLSSWWGARKLLSLKRASRPRAMCEGIAKPSEEAIGSAFNHSA